MSFCCHNLTNKSHYHQYRIVSDFFYHLFVYMSNTLIGRLEKSFNSCIYNLLKVNLQHLDLAEQFKLLS